LGVVDSDQHQPVGRSVGKRIEKKVVDNAKHRGCRTDTEGEGKDGDGSETRVLAELSDTVATIGDHGVQPIASAFFANLLLHLFHAAKFDLLFGAPFLKQATESVHEINSFPVHTHS
jgi:hypothetical protein